MELPLRHSSSSIENGFDSQNGQSVTWTLGSSTDYCASCVSSSSRVSLDLDCYTSCDVGCSCQVGDCLGVPTSVDDKKNNASIVVPCHCYTYYNYHHCQRFPSSCYCSFPFHEREASLCSTTSVANSEESYVNREGPHYPCNNYQGSL
ncbi:unnamed protein product [Orchesella dallaii]|uniref:Uncharacterized protein n=1 Tax=Orchesella dallaii TaxID=48710 RepID=A0ABP1RZK7_9HEXA